MDAPIVLVIDAEPAVHDRVGEALAEEECMLLGARSETLALWLAARRPPSVVIIDAGSVPAPAEVLLRLQQIVPHVRALVLTSDPVESGTARWASVGPVLHKPLDPARLRSTVRSLSRLSAMTSGVAEMRGDAAAVHAVWRRIATTRRHG
jgi:DNA-binding response OmpR family regulator